MIEEYNLDRFDKEDVQGKQFYLTHTFGLPYLTGIGISYFQNKFIYFTELNTSFIFSSANLGCNYRVIENFYIGVNTGIIYQPTKDNDITPQLSGELLYSRTENYLIRSGVQLPLEQIKHQFIPYFRVTYLFD